MAITKYRSQLFDTTEHVKLHLRRAQNAVAPLGRNLGERLQQTLRARKNDMQNPLANSREAIVGTSDKITKYRSQLFDTSEHVKLHLRQARNALAPLGRNVAERLQQALRARKNDVQNLLANSREAIAGTYDKITKYRSQLFDTSEHVKLHLRQARN